MMDYPPSGAAIAPIAPPGRVAPAGHYAYGVVAGGFIHVSGQLPVGLDGIIDPAMPFAEQAERVLDHVEAILAEAGASLADLVKVDVFITDMAQWGTFDRIYAARMGQARPARAVIPVPELHFGFAIELAAMALAPA